MPEVTAVDICLAIDVIAVRALAFHGTRWSRAPTDRVIDDGNELDTDGRGSIARIDDHLIEPAHLLRMLVAVPDADMNDRTRWRCASKIAQ